MSTKRAIGMGSCGEIPYDDIERYAVSRGLDTANAEMFEIVIRRMDAAYLKWLKENPG